MSYGSIPSNYNTTFDLSNFLPNDNNIYEILLTAYGNTNANGNVLGVSVATQIFSSWFIKCGGSATDNNHTSLLTVVGSDRKIRIYSDGAIGINSIYIRINGYRKVK